VKITRGVFSRLDEDEYPGDEESRDSDGSVKAALIAAMWIIRRSAALLIVG
jgi:hypothetical protein